MVSFDRFAFVTARVTSLLASTSTPSGSRSSSSSSPRRDAANAANAANVATVAEVAASPSPKMTYERLRDDAASSSSSPADIIIRPATLPLPAAGRCVPDRVDEGSSTTTTTASSSSSSVEGGEAALDGARPIIIHFCFVVHGHNGRPSDLSYLNRAVRERAREMVGPGSFADARASGACTVGRATDAEGDGGGDGDGDGEAHGANDSNGGNDGTKARRRRRRRKRDRLSSLLPRKGGSDGNGHGHGHGHDCPGDKNAEAPAAAAIVDAIHDDTDNTAGKSNSRSGGGTLVVHNAACNEGKTHDGIIKGGERLVDEMLDVIRSEVAMERNDDDDGPVLRRRHSNDDDDDDDDPKSPPPPPVDVTVSIVGNSLGGLYGRYAVARLAEVLGDPIRSESSNDGDGDGDGDDDDQSKSCHYLLDHNVRVHPNVFCSTCSPHLGCASHTYVPIPRAAEMGIAQALGETGSDLFRTNDLVETMATSSRFLEPLAAFRSRIAYANAYGTDFPVPGTTAAFLDKDSGYPHYFDEHFAGVGHDETTAAETTTGGEEDSKGVESDPVDDDRGKERRSPCPASERGLIVATLHTPRSTRDGIDAKGDVDTLTAMSSSLDSLGWKKVIVDIRNEIVMAVPLPAALTTAKSPPDDCPIRRLKSGGRAAVSSRDLERAISNTSGGGRRLLGLPLGHNAMCAFSRGAVSTAVNSGGRPVMDSLAIDLTREISSWRMGDSIIDRE